MNKKTGINYNRELIKYDRKFYMEKHNVEDNNETYHKYLDSLYDLVIQDHPTAPEWLKVLGQVFFVDAYKLLNHRVIQNTARPDDIALFNHLDSICESMLTPDKFKKVIFEDRQLLYDISDKFFWYTNLAEVDKYMMVHSISEQKHNQLNQILPFHSCEISEHYKVLDTNGMNKLYTDLNEKIYVSYPYMTINPYEKMADLLLFVEKTDNKAYLGIFKDIAQTYYKWNRFLDDQNAELVSKNDRVIMHGLENINIDEFATYESYNKVLAHIIKGYMSFSKGAYIVYYHGDTILFNEDVVDYHLYEKVPKTVLNRMKFEKGVEKNKNS